MHLAAEALMHLSTSKPSQPAEEHDSSHPAASPEQDPSLTLGFSFFSPAHNQSLNLGCSSYSTFLFSHFVCPSISALLSVWLSLCDDNNLFYIPVVSFLVETGQGRLSVPGHIHQRQTLIGLWCNLLYGQDELGYLFPPLAALSGPVTA